MGGQKTKLNEDNERTRDEIQARIDDMAVEAGYNTPHGEKNDYVLSKLDTLQGKLNAVNDDEFDKVVSDVLTAMAKLDVADVRQHYPLNDVVERDIRHYIMFVPILIKDAEASGDQEALQDAMKLSEDILDLEDDISLVPTEQQIDVYHPVRTKINVKIVSIQETITDKQEAQAAASAAATSSASSASTMFRQGASAEPKSAERRRKHRHRSGKSSSRSPATTRRTSGRR